MTKYQFFERFCINFLGLDNFKSHKVIKEENNTIFRILKSRLRIEFIHSALYVRIDQKQFRLDYLAEFETADYIEVKNELDKFLFHCIVESSDKIEVLHS